MPTTHKKARARLPGQPLGVADLRMGSNLRLGEADEASRRVRHTDGLGSAVAPPVIDPTENVIALTNAANRRQDDLRELNNLRIDSDIRHVECLMDLRASHQAALDALEAKRLDAVRSVDQLAVKTEADRSAAAITALANAAATTAETLRSAVNTSATNLATQLTNTVNAITERIAALEKSSYTGQGKQAVVDPQLTEMLGEMRALRAVQALGTGKSEGMDATWKLIIAGVGLLVALNALGVFTRTPVPKPDAPQVIYVPAPAGSMLPTTPPQPAPR